MLVLALNVGAFLRPYFAQANLITAIRNAGGTVATRPGPKWLSTVLGEANCRSILVVNLADIEPSEELLASVSTLPDLEILVLGGDSITDDTLRHVPSCESFDALVLDSTLVTQKAMESLRKQRAELFVSNCDRLLLERTYSQLRMLQSTTTRICPDAAPDLQFRIAEEFATEVVGLDGVFTYFLTMDDVTLMRRFPQLESIRFVGDFSVSFDSDSMPSGSRRPNLPNHTEIIRSLVELPNLRELEIGFRDLDWLEGLSPLQEMQTLRVYTETDEAYFLTDDDVSQLLDRFPHLKELSLEDAAVTSPSKWPQIPLEALSLSGCKIDDSSLEQIASHFPRLKRLQLGMTDVTDGGIQELLPLHELEELGLVGTRVTEDSYETLCGFPRLKRLQIGVLNLNANYGQGSDFTSTKRRYFEPEDQPFQNGLGGYFSRERFRPDIKQMDRIRQRLSKGEVERFAFRSHNYFAITPMESLSVEALQIPEGITAIDFTDTYLDDAGLEHVCDFPQLEVIKLQNTWVSDAGLRHLKKLENLRSIDLAETRTTAACVNTLIEISSLESIRLPASADGNCAESLLELPNLRYVSVFRAALDRRPWMAKQLTMEDLAQFRQLAGSLFARTDANGDGVITEADFERSVTFSRISREGSDGSLELRDSEELLKVMLYRCMAVPEVRVELRN